MFCIIYARIANTYVLEGKLIKVSYPQRGEAVKTLVNSYIGKINKEDRIIFIIKK